MYTSRNKMLILFKRGFYCSGVSSYTEGAEGGTLDWPVNKVGGKDNELKAKKNYLKFKKKQQDRRKRQRRKR